MPAMVTTAALLLLLFIALLAIPLRLIFNLSWQQAVHGEVTLQWLFGLVRISLPLPSQARVHPQQNGQPAATSSRGNATPSKLNIAQLWQQKSLRERFLRFLRTLWHAINKRELNIYLRVGLDDPAETGRLWAILGPLAGMLYTIRDAHIEIEPDFLESGLAVESSGNIQFIPLQLLVIIGEGLLSPSLWRDLRQARTARNG